MKREDVDWSDREEAAEYLTEIAGELAWMIRDEPPAAVEKALAAKVPESERTALIMVMAAMIPDTETPDALLAWTLAARHVPRCDERLVELHKAYLSYREMGYTNALMPHGVVEGERVVQAVRVAQMKHRKAVKR